jgi:hypothetical protein
MALDYQKLLNSKNCGLYCYRLYHVHGELLTFSTQTIKSLWSLLQGLRWAIIDVCDCKFFKSGSGHCIKLFRHDENGF